MHPTNPQSCTQDPPPAYTAPRNAPMQTSTHQNSLPPPLPPPSYHLKRTPSQEEIYIRELKAWAAEKGKMYPGAYGEHTSILPNPSPVSHHDDRRGDGGTLEDVGGGDGGEGVSSSGDVTREISDRETRRKDSVEEANIEVKEESARIKEVEVLKRRMSSFMRKLGRHGNESVRMDQTDDGVSDGL